MQRCRSRKDGQDGSPLAERRLETTSLSPATAATPAVRANVCARSPCTRSRSQGVSAPCCAWRASPYPRTPRSGPRPCSRRPRRSRGRGAPRRALTRSARSGRAGPPRSRSSEGCAQGNGSNRCRPPSGRGRGCPRLARAPGTSSALAARAYPSPSGFGSPRPSPPMAAEPSLRCRARCGVRCRTSGPPRRGARTARPAGAGSSRASGAPEGTRPRAAS
mmetsp:Transcript_58993/g.157743  ORF Transcript_58993/g.157743 Transcript_58993/m.157743 type:complete len:219 (-) Transcript_58993:187-843(-)